MMEMERGKKAKSIAKALANPVLAVLMLSALAACAVGRAPVSGIVLDKGTGKPIKGADVETDASFYTIFPPMETDSGGAAASGVTDAEGKFSFGADALLKPSDYGAGYIPSMLMPKKVNGIGMTVYSKDYIPVNVRAPSHLYGREWKSGDVSMVKRGAGYRFTIKMTRAVDEKTWKKKCRATILLSGGAAEGKRARWLFNDLTGYLERWPEGEKAAEYYYEVWSTATMGTCEDIRDELIRGEMTRRHLRVLCDRAEKIISLRKDSYRPEWSVTKDALKRGFEESKKNLACAKRLLEDNNIPKREENHDAR